jgi:hypothetical protein
MRWTALAAISITMILVVSQTAWPRGERPPDGASDDATNAATEPVRLSLYVTTTQVAEDKPFRFVVEIENVGNEQLTVDPELRMDSQFNPPLGPRSEVRLPGDRIFVLLHLVRPQPNLGNREMRDIDPRLMITDNRTGRDLVIPAGRSSFARVDLDPNVLLTGENTVELTAVLNGDVIVSSGLMHIQCLPSKP